jgi:hypothetical protein
MSSLTVFSMRVRTLALARAEKDQNVRKGDSDLGRGPRWITRVTRAQPQRLHDLERGFAKQKACRSRPVRGGITLNGNGGSEDEPCLVCRLSLWRSPLQTRGAFALRMCRSQISKWRRLSKITRGAGVDHTAHDVADDEQQRR